MRINIKTLITVVLVALVAACKTPQNITYFQDVNQNSSVKLQQEQIFRLRPEDKINIFVSSKDPSLSSLFTLGSSNQRGTSGTYATAASSGSSSNGYTLPYTVDKDGNIDFPVLGTLYVQDKTRQELAKEIQKELISRKLVLDPIVTVEYLNMGISVLGEVNRPGRVDISRDHFTILDAITAAGDLTITGMRDSVSVLRKVDGNLKRYDINLTSVNSITTSPAYYLQQEDIVYVAPSDMKKRQSTVNGNSMLTPSFWFSIASFVASMGAIVVNVLK